jgi:hypothetical protein
MASQRLAICFIFLLAGYDVQAARVKLQQSEKIEEIENLYRSMEKGFQMSGDFDATGYQSSASRATCDKDIIVESSDGSKALVLAHEYESTGAEVLQKHGGTCTLTYSVVCSGGSAAIRKDSTCGASSTRSFNAFHWWRDTEIRHSKGETGITFSEGVALQPITSGKVTFTPSGSSCQDTAAEMQRQALRMEGMLKQDQVRKFKEVSSVLKGYASKRHEMISMGCPADMVDESDSKIAEEMRAYFDKHQGGRDSPMADARFSAALDKIRSVQDFGRSPTKQDFAEAVALMRFGACPEAEETRISADSLTRLVDEVDESAEEQLEDDLQACMDEERCDAISAKFPQGSSLIQLDVNSSAVMQTRGFLADFVLFLSVLVLCVIFWPVVWIVLLTYFLVLLALAPFTLLAGRDVVYELRHYHLGAFDYLVDEYCRPAIDSPTGFPLRLVESSIVPAMPAPPVRRYATYGGAPLIDVSTGWPIAMFQGDVVKPLVGLPKPFDAATW